MYSYKRMMNDIARESKILHAITSEERRILQDNALEIMDSVFRICKKYNLNIMLGGGSALGAVRHKGFIPWDDDIDLNMPRKDFEKLKKIFQKELGDDYRLFAPNYNGKAIARFAKVEKRGTILETLENTHAHGICIDIFPIENIPKNKFVFFIKGLVSQIVMFITGQVEFWNNRNDLIKSVMSSRKDGKISYSIKSLIGFLFSVVPLNKWYDLTDKVNQYRYTGIMGVPSGRKHYFGEIFEEEVYLPIREGEFEGRKVYLPNDVDKYLQNLFGDYMQIPPKSKREQHFIIRVND